MLQTLILCNSCMGQEVQRLSYVQHVLDEKAVPELPIKHNSWKKIKLSEVSGNPSASIKSQTVIYVDIPLSVDEIDLPENVELHYCGGSIKGNLVFNKTYLSGKINLRETTLSGSITNEIFEAGWICNGDGKTDDAKAINQAIKVCNTIHFQKGAYLLSSLHSPSENLDSKFHEAVRSHIGIYKSNIKLIGDEGASLVSKDKNRVITIYSSLNQIKNSVKNIVIEGLTFRVENDGKEFQEFIHTIKTLGVNKLSISRCQFFDYWGDAICLSHYGDDPSTGERTRNSNVTIEGNYIDGGNRNNRNGISIISGYNVKITNNTFKETSLKGMPGAIDIEANNTAYTVKNIVIINNVIDNSTSCGISIYCNKQGASAHNVTIANNSISNCYYGVKIEIYNDYSTSNFTIQNNATSGCRNPFVCKGESKSKNWKIVGNIFPGIKQDKMVGDLKVERLSIR